MKTLFLSFSLLCASLASAALPEGLFEIKELKGQDARGTYNLKYLQLTDKLGSPEARALINQDLKQQAESYLCEEDVEESDRLSAELSMDPNYVNERVLGISYYYDKFCAGAYPNTGREGLVYDLQSGKLVENVEKEMRDQTAFRRLVVAEVLANPAAKESAEGCQEFYTEEQLTEGFYTYELTEGGLNITQSYPHAIQACAFTTTLSYEKVRPLVKDESPLATLK